ncbi:unnamed protein product [Phytophthora fragariaefolia]|uniref:Unnamed protein product n=1 Tax=Phytophthora fragariaefolia TaxID=1490495 RepID=A0A9W6XJ72_9STRA|nr:unnamed protein product [Phytophthora fragariaefolia]
MKHARSENSIDGVNFHTLLRLRTNFESEWINGRFWRWQVYHTPQGYPTTNNPCEVFNAVIKAFVQRRRFHMRLLLQRLMVLIETLELKKPVTPSYVAVTTSELVTEATEIINSKQIIVTKTNLHRTVCVKKLRIPASQEVITYSAGTISDFAAAFGDSADMVAAEPSRMELTVPVMEEHTPEMQVVEGNEGVTQNGRLHPSIAENEIDAISAREQQLETKAVKWSMHRAHRLGMPDQGWIVDLDRRVCGCKYFSKMLTCAHIIVAERSLGLGVNRYDPTAKLKNRVQRKKLIKSKKANVNKNKDKQNHRVDSVTIGRPPKSASVLNVQFILN